ncbi:MAG: hypothetical protein M0Z48_08670 [Nitrospiraceae bacterium]|nr:hypothetical protein [Nitrospiraceae bacterium]
MTGTKRSECPAMDMPAPDELGRVVIGNYSKAAGLPPVVFDHWLHRAMYTCRLCHVDLGFAMQAGGTGIRAADNMRGFYCGACHDGKRTYGGKTIFAACSDSAAGAGGGRCVRCHSRGRQAPREYRFNEFTKKLPGENGMIDWEKAEEEGLVSPSDYLEGVSIKRPKLRAPKDFSLEARCRWMPGIIFSHKKHAVWNGCEVCHPDIFPVKLGGAKFSMLDIVDGEYCGACHGKVAFPVAFCNKCHSK